MAPKQFRFKHFTFPKDRLTIGLLVAFVVVGIATAFLAFRYVSNFVAGWNLTNLPGVTVPTASNIQGTLNATQLAAIPTSALNSNPTAQPWDGISRINILIMGLDYDWETGGSTAQRSDSMILLTLDPASNTAGMLSIPRDLWVDIPGFGYGKINTAYWFGQAYNLPGGGPGLAIKTVQNLLGITINYYAQIDFNAFIAFINDIKGVKLTITQEMVVGLQGKDQKVTLEPGTWTLDGATALAYARDRHTENGDFDRSSRQMQVIMAVRDRILEFNMLPNLIANAPNIYTDLSSGIHTNLTLDQIIQLAILAFKVPKANITQVVIGTTDVDFGTSPDGTQDILIPMTDKIRAERDKIFTSGAAISPTVVATDPVKLMQAEGARVSILNGSTTSGLANQAGDYLKTQGLNVVEESNGTATNTTIIIDHTGCPYTVQYLAKLFNVTSANIKTQYDASATSDVTVTLGDDWAATGKLPAQ